MARSGLAEHVEFEDDVAIGRSDHRGILSLLQGLWLNCAGKKAIFYLGSFELYIFQLVPWLSLGLIGHPCVSAWLANGLFLFDGLQA